MATFCRSIPRFIMDGDNLHIVMLPWPGFGHLLPFLELTKRIAQLGHRISFLSTAANISRLAPNVPPSLSQLIRFVELTLPQVDGLPAHVQSTKDLSDQGDMSSLYKAFDALENQVAIFLEKASPSPDWIIYDCVPHWVPQTAARSGVPCAYLGLPSATLHGYLGPPSSLMGGEGARVRTEQLTSKPDWVPFPSSVAYRPHEARQVFKDHFHPSGLSGGFRLGMCIKGAQVVAIRSCMELEAEWLSLLEVLYQKPVIPVGHFPSPAPTNYGGWEDAFKWLDEQAMGSVVYVAFGSELQLTREQVHQIALGLELSELPFIWGLRLPGPEMLPDGFEDRTKGRGVVCKGWVPQVKFLAHTSVGGFLTHCGWSSLVEALQFGVALVLLPLLNDEGLNARLMEEKKVGIEVPREEDGSFLGSAIQKTLRLVMLEEEGKASRARAKELSAFLGDKEVQDRYVKDFIGYLRTHKSRQGRAISGSQA